MEVKDAYKFCPRCGQDFKLEENRLQCHSCGLSFYINPKACALAVLVNDKDELLLTKRAFEPAKGLWDLPGGFLEVDETLEESVRREVKEELGLDLDIEDLHYLTSSTANYLFQDINQPLVIAIFIGRLPKGTALKATDDVSEFAFFLADKLPYGEFSHPAMEGDMRKAIEYLRNSKL